MNKQEIWQKLLEWIVKKYDITKQPAKILKAKYQVQEDKLISDNEDKLISDNKEVASVVYGDENSAETVRKTLAGMYDQICAKIPDTKPNFCGLTGRKQADEKEQEFYNWLKNQLTGSDFTSSLKDDYVPILLDCLWDINYRQEKRDFADIIMTEPKVLSFLIHGPEKYCQNWLIDRLCDNHFPKLTKAQKIVISLDQNRHNRSEKLWQEIRDQLFIQSNDPSQIAQTLKQNLESQPVVLFCKNVKPIPNPHHKSMFQQCINNFWTELVELTQQHNQPKNHLVLFLIDHTNCEFNRRINCVPRYDPNQPTNTIEIALKNFAQKDIELWLNIAKTEKIFKPALILHKDTKWEDIRTKIINSHGQTPQEIFEEICRFFHLEWTDIEDKLKLLQK